MAPKEGHARVFSVLCTLMHYEHLHTSTYTCMCTPPHTHIYILEAKKENKKGKEWAGRRIARAEQGLSYTAVLIKCLHLIFVRHI